MDKVVDVVIPSLGKPHASVCASLLRYIPWPMRLHWIVEGRSWPEAVNLGLAESTGDVILMDDDVFLRPSTFSYLNPPAWPDGLFNQADIFGFKLLYPDGKIQHAGAYYDGQIIRHYGHGEIDKGQHGQPLYVGHVTTSLVYIKRRVLDALKGMATDMPGMQFEDVDFCLRALKAGFKILYTPGEAGHLESATKRFMLNFPQRMADNWEEIKKRHLADKGVVDELERYHREKVRPLEQVS